MNKRRVVSRGTGRGITILVVTAPATSVVGEKFTREIIRAVREALTHNKRDDIAILVLT